MKSIDEYDSDYANRVAEACYSAILGASLDKATNTAVMRSAEIFNALILCTATFAATSDAAASPTKIRNLSDDYAKRLRRRLSQARKLFEEGAMPFDVINKGDLN